LENKTSAFLGFFNENILPGKSYFMRKRFERKPNGKLFPEKKTFLENEGLKEIQVI
jgi:hypothetical protein